MKYNPKVTEYIQQAPPQQIELLEALRAIIFESVAGVSGEIKWRMPVFSASKNFAYIRHTKKYAVIGFYNADKLPDPQNILEGEGKAMRHVKIYTSEDIDEKQFRAWLKIAAA